METLPTIQFTAEQKALAENCIKAIANKTIAMTPEFYAKQVLQNIKAKGVKVTADDVLTVFKIASDMGLDPSTKDIYAFKSQKIPLTVGVSFRGWSRACEKKDILGIDYEPLDYGKDKNGNKVMDRLKVTITKSNGGKVSYIINRSQAMTTSEVWQTESDHMLQIRGFCRCASLAFGWGAYEVGEAREFFNGEEKLGSSVHQIEVQEIKPTLMPHKAITATLNDDELIKALKSAETLQDLRQIFAGGSEEQRKNAEIIRLCQDLKTKFN